ncbi:hypothetical protein PGTUg99_002060 [Puccinia graminis f. sp. tritici]|uniref:Uncharacterized protein n=1 Tax=Puccinia graminis f. sp. tritici TaxID=56615 RepID=A0A5B0RRD2_PUCGR|nr:hypothetical protein PGTUg99_002060 [Puccinia graminis f. sp. tritici]
MLPSCPAHDRPESSPGEDGRQEKLPKQEEDEEERQWTDITPTLIQGAHRTSWRRMRSSLHPISISSISSQPSKSWTPGWIRELGEVHSRIPNSTLSNP